MKLKLGVIVFVIAAGVALAHLATSSSTQEVLGDTKGISGGEGSQTASPLGVMSQGDEQTKDLAENSEEPEVEGIEKKDTEEETGAENADLSSGIEGSGQDELESKPATSLPGSMYDQAGEDLGPTIVDMLLPRTSSGERVSEPYSHIMLHFTSDVVNNPEKPHSVQRVYNIFREYGVGSHYLIARDGTIYRFIDESRKAYHAGLGSLPGFPELTDKLNDYSVGIEILAVGTEEEMSSFIDSATYARIPEGAIGYTDAQYSALRVLIADIVSRNERIEFDRAHIVGHDEYASDRKTDPGSLFDWSRVGL